MRLERPTEEDMAEGAAFPPGSVHLPHWVENEWLKQFVAEQLVTVRTKRGFARLEWQELRERKRHRPRRVAGSEGHVSATPQVGTGCGDQGTSDGEY